MPVTGNLLGTAVSGLIAYQRALAVTGHNTANVNTPGYSRQRVELDTRIPSGSTFGFIGNGVAISTISRAYDQFVTAQLRTTTSSSSQLDAHYSFARQIDNIVADTQTGLAPALQAFFNSVSEVSNNPSSTATRQVMLSQADALINRFIYLDDRLADLQASANTQVRAAITDINSYTQSIAGLNQQIFDQQGLQAGQPPNDLLDQRDEAIRKLSELMSVNVVAQDNGMLNAYTSDGQILVLGNSSSTLSALQNEFDPTNLDIGLSVGGGAIANITNAISGGTLGGTLEFRDGLLQDVRNELGRIAVGFSVAFNDQHRLGLDMSDQLGGDFFSDLSTQDSISGRNNNVATDYTFTSTITDIGALKASDYRIDYSGGTYSMIRLSDNTIVGNSVTPTFNLTATEGFTVSSVGTAISNGDSFLLRVTSRAAGGIGIEVSNVNEIAAAAPVRTIANLSNTGSGRITQGSVSNTTNLPLAGSITLTFNPNALGAGIPGFTVTGGPGGTIAYDPATESGGKTFTFAAYGGFTFDISGTPASGDTFVIQSNLGGAGDNRNARALAQLQTLPIMVNGATGPTLSISGMYSQLVSDVGARTRQSEINSKAQNTLLTQAQEAWGNKSGVNLDEEAANLIKYQQIYQASAQVVTAATVIFESLLGALR